MTATDRRANRIRARTYRHRPMSTPAMTPGIRHANAEVLTGTLALVPSSPKTRSSRRSSVGYWLSTSMAHAEGTMPAGSGVSLKTAGSVPCGSMTYTVQPAPPSRPSGVAPRMWTIWAESS